MGLRQLLREEWAWFTAVRGKAARLDSALCRGCWTCYEVCPVGCFRPDRERHVEQSGMAKNERRMVGMIWV